MRTSSNNTHNTRNSKKKIVLADSLLLSIHCSARSWSEFSLFCQSLQKATGANV
ncbi:hypothetical protein ACFL53_00400 [Pseudomonadota bacterium]